MAIDLANNEYAKKLMATNLTPKEFIVEPRVYFHVHNYAKFHFDLGGSRVKSVQFANHRYVTDDKREQDQLDLVANIPGTFVYTIDSQEAIRVLDQELANEKKESIMKTAQAAAAVAGQGFDASTPIVEVVNHSVGNIPVQCGIVGTANSFSGAVATESLSHVAMTQAAEQKTHPTAQSLAIEALNDLTNKVKTP